MRLSFILSLAYSFFIIHVHGDNFLPPENQIYHAQVQRNLLKVSHVQRVSASSPSPAPAPSPMTSVTRAPLVYHVTSYGADPTGKADSTEEILRALSDAFRGPKHGFLMDGIANLGGARIDLDGGNYIISRPLRFPGAGGGNVVIHGGTLKASDNFPTDGYLLDLSSWSNGAKYSYEFVTFRDIMVDSNYRGGGIRITNSVRISIDNCFFSHFVTNGVLVQGGHETYIRNSFLGQHITAGGDPRERNFTGTAINLMGNDNAVTDVIIFSAAIGIMVAGQANTLSGVHCYNKATGFGGTGIYIKLPGKTQTRIINSYMDYTGIVAEDPVQLLISGTFFLGDAYIVLKSIKGIASGVSIVDNMFSGSGKGIDIVRLDQANGPFKEINQVIVDRNSVGGMKLRSTVARGSVQGNGTSWTIDFNHVLLFRDAIKRVQYTFITSSAAFHNHVLRNMSNNRVLIESNVRLLASVFVVADQAQSWSS